LGQLSSSSAFEKRIALKTKESNFKHLDAKMTIFAHVPVLTLRDNTQFVIIQRLIREEKKVIKCLPQ
jgi:hypothetical protein